MGLEIVVLNRGLDKFKTYVMYINVFRSGRSDRCLLKQIQDQLKMLLPFQCL